MTITAKLYYLAGALALAAAAISIFNGGFTEDEYLRVGFLAAMALFLFWMGSRQHPKPPE